jgi:hypothetical protein
VDLFSFALLLLALIIGVAMMVAQFQLFAIRQLLEQPVLMQQPKNPAVAPSPAPKKYTF